MGNKTSRKIKKIVFKYYATFFQLHFSGFVYKIPMYDDLEHIYKTVVLTFYDLTDKNKPIPGKTSDIMFDNSTPSMIQTCIDEKNEKVIVVSYYHKKVGKQTSIASEHRTCGCVWKKFNKKSDVIIHLSIFKNLRPIK